MSCVIIDFKIMIFFFFKQKTAYEIKECDWSSDVCSSDLNMREYIQNNPLKWSLDIENKKANIIDKNYYSKMIL